MPDWSCSSEHWWQVCTESAHGGRRRCSIRWPMCCRTRTRSCSTTAVHAAAIAGGRAVRRVSTVLDRDDRRRLRVGGTDTATPRRVGARPGVPARRPAVAFANNLYVDSGHGQMYAAKVVPAVLLLVIEELAGDVGAFGGIVFGADAGLLLGLLLWSTFYLGWFAIVIGAVGGSIALVLQLLAGEGRRVVTSGHGALAVDRCRCARLRADDDRLPHDLLDGAERVPRPLVRGGGRSGAETVRHRQRRARQRGLGVG